MSFSQRRNYFISKSMQSKFAGTILLLVILVTIVTACNIYVLATFFLQTKATLAENQTVEGLLRMFINELWPRLLLLVMVNVIIVIIISILYSHSFAGPAYKLEKSIQKIANGDLTLEIRLRKNDSLKEVAAAINQMLAKFRETIAAAKYLANDITDKLKSFENDEKFKPLIKSAEELKQHISHFRITSDEVQQTQQVQQIQQKQQV